MLEMESDLETEDLSGLLSENSMVGEWDWVKAEELEHLMVVV